MTSPLILSKDAELNRFAGFVLAGLASEDMLAQWKNQDDIRAIKTDTGVYHYHAVSTVPEERKARAQDAKPRSYEFVANEESRDRSGDIIKVAGWDLANFKRNPIALVDHYAATQCIVGSVTNMVKATEEKPPRLYETIVFPDEGVSEVADVNERLVAAGLLRTVSVGFLPIKVSWPESDEEREKLGVGRYGCLYEKQEQLELSIVAIPCHPNATLTGKALDREQMKLAGELGRMVKAEVISKKQAAAYLSATRRRSVHRMWPLKAAPESSTQTPAGSSVSTESRDAVSQVGTSDNAAQLLALEALTKRLDAAEAREQKALARIDVLERDVAHARSVLAASELTSGKHPAAKQAAMEDAALFTALERELGLVS